MRHRFASSRLSLVLALAAGAMAGALPGCRSAAKDEPAASKPATSSSPARASAKAPAEGAPPSAPAPDPLAALGYRLEWKGYAVVGRGKRVQFFQAYPDLIVTQDTGNTLTAIEPQTGRKRWSAGLGGDLIRFVGHTRNDAGDILSCGETELMVLSAKSGDLLARQRFAELANTPPLAVGTMLLIGCVNGQLLGHNMVSGYKLWAYQLEGAISSPPVMTGTDAAAVSGAGEVLIVSPQHGTRVSGTRVFAGIDNTPAADDRSVYIAGKDQSIWSFDRYNGSTRWRIRTAYPLTRQPALHDGRLYISIPHEGLACIEASNGTRIWTAAGIDGDVIGVRAGRLLVWDGRSARALDDVTGDPVAAADLPGQAFVRPDAFIDGNLYLASPSGEILKYSPRR